MREKLEHYQEKLTDRERLAVWERVRDARGASGALDALSDADRRRALWPKYRLAGSLAIGLLAIGAVVAVHRATQPEQIAERRVAQRVESEKRADRTRRSLNFAWHGDSTDTARPGSYPEPDVTMLAKKGAIDEIALAKEALDRWAENTVGIAKPSETSSRITVAETADSLEIRGVVVDAKSGAPIAFANVTLEGTHLGANTSLDGTFAIRGLVPGTYVLRVAMLGFATQLDSVLVAPRAPAEIRFALAEAEVTTLASIGVKDQERRGEVESASSSTAIDTKYEFRHRAPTDQLSSEKSTAMNSQDGQLHVRGGRASEAKRLANGLPSPDASATAGIQELGDGGLMSSPAQTEVLHSLGNGGGGGGWSAAALGAPHVPVHGGSTLPNDEVYDSMFFEHYGVNPFIPTDEDSQSTFAVDVDAASYTVARRYIDGGHLPPQEAARVEEFVNFFEQDYPSFTDVDFRVLIDAAPSPFGNGYQLMRVGIKGREVDARNRKPANLVFVIDTSGSMNREDRITLVKRSLHLLLDELRPDDTVGIVAYSNDARVVLEPAALGGAGEDDESDPRAMRDGAGRDARRDDRVRLAGPDEVARAIDALWPDGGTNAEAGLTLGYEMARRAFRPGAINRIILCSDGVANIGRTGSESILESVRREADRGIHLSAIGVGMGNYNDVLLEQLANRGDGNYYYVDDIDEARRVFVENLTGTLQTIAKDAKVQVEFDPRLVLRYRLLGFENRDVADRDFRNDAIDAGEIGAGHEVTALYEVKLASGVTRGRLAAVRLRYAAPEDQLGAAGRVREIETGFDARDIARSFDAASPRLRLAAVVAEFAEILRHSYWAKENTIAALVPMARALARDLPRDPAVAEFAQLVERAADLSDKLTPEERRALEPPPLPAGMRDGVSMR
ncbi:MAG: von Willebrand factor type A domain-containing protein [bacterium]